MTTHHDAVLYLLRQRVCSMFGHQFEPATARNGITLEDDMTELPIGILAEECARCHACKLLIFPND